MKVRKITHDDLMAVFEKQVEYHPREKLSEKKAKIIRQRFRDGYSIPDCVKAIIGIHHTEHNLGKNDRATKYLGIHIALHEDNIVRFIEVGEEVEAKRNRDTSAQAARKRAKTTEYIERKTLTQEERDAEAEEFRQLRKAHGI